MNLIHLAALHPVLLAEGSIFERVRRAPGLRFDPAIAHAGLIYDETGRAHLEAIHREYLAIGPRSGLPMVVLTDTWRASQSAIERSTFKGRPVNEDNVQFLLSICQTGLEKGYPHCIGGLIGPAGDAYRPDQALSEEHARAYHAAQIEALVASSVDFVLASTLPALSEALGMAAVLGASGKPYLLSFVVRNDGTLLDGTLLGKAIQTIDDSVSVPPLGYLMNCVHPTICLSTLDVLASTTPEKTSRFFGLQANTSGRTPEELDMLDTLETEAPEQFARGFLAISSRFPMRLVGGCCGTDARHIDALARAFAPRRNGTGKKG